MKMSIELTGRKITLRTLKKSDADSIYKYVRSPDIPRYTFVPSPYMKEHAIGFIKRSHIWRRNGTSYIFGIVPHDAGEVVGTIGLHDVSAVHKKTEIGYWLGKKFRGQGYMQEAIELVLKFCFSELKLYRVQATALLDNVISQKLLKRCGFKYEGRHRNFLRQRKRIKDAHMYAITKEDYRTIRRKK